MSNNYFAIDLIYDGSECMLKDGPLSDDGRIIVEVPQEIEQMGGEEEAVLVDEVTNGQFTLQRNRRNLHDLLMMGARLAVSYRIKNLLDDFLPSNGTGMLPVAIFDPKRSKKLADYFWLYSNQICWEPPYPSNAEIFKYAGGSGVEWLVTEGLVNRLLKLGVNGIAFTLRNDETKR